MMTSTAGHQCEGNVTFGTNVTAGGPFVRQVERVCVNLECVRSRLAEDLHSLAGAWQLERRFLGALGQECRSTKPSELSALAELRGFDRFIYLKPQTSQLSTLSKIQ